MTVHISVRLAWHDTGWNGHICRDPKANTYCIGQNSYQQEMIVADRNLDWEIPLAGKSCHGLDGVPPCIHSINAFGQQDLNAYISPPDWFNDGTETKTWSLPAYTVATWPYEEMYKDEVITVNQVKGQSKYDAAKRRAFANTYFDAIQEDRSLIFYYANYSNPFSDTEENRYVIVGMSRVKALGDELPWINQSASMANRYGPNAWARNITSHYPDQGLRIPYHAYMDRPDILEKILFVPDDSRLFKYATRHISDDGSLSLVERMQEIVQVLQEIGDQHENWEERQRWLASLMAELWQHRGLYPGLLRVMEFLDFKEAVPYAKDQIERGNERAVKDALFALIHGNTQDIPGLTVSSNRLDKVRRQWRLLDLAQQVLVEQELPRFDLKTPQIEQIIRNPESVGILASLDEVGNNPYILCEYYQGIDADDKITFRQIDNGKFPSPNLGDTPEFDVDGWQRLRAICIDQLKRARQHAFLPANIVLNGVNHVLSFMPEWKRTQFIPGHLELDRQHLEKGLTLRYEDNKQYIYRKEVYEDERLVETELRNLAQRPDIRPRSPVTEAHWRAYLHDTDSELAKHHPQDYERVIDQQVSVCSGVFPRPISVLCGAAGTGKTTVVSAIISAIEKAHGTGTSIQLLAPTGKAADRLRERTGKEASTVHSFLAKRGWLNDNLSLKRRGGQRESGITTFIIDESSMLDLSLMAAFFRAVNWNTVQRLILVGDPNQLPPIGTGRVYADLIDWLSTEMPEHVGQLETNMRLRINELSGNGTGILELADLYTRCSLEETKSEDRQAKEETMLARVQEGGDVTKDLRVLYWSDTDELETLLLNTIVADMEADTKKTLDPEKPYDLWNAALVSNKIPYPEASQVISPYRGELFGIENLNRILQSHKNSWWLENKGGLAGITVFDKVIQVKNRPKSNPLWAYDTVAKRRESVEVFNGEIGMSGIHGYDGDSWRRPNFRVEKFQVVFTRKLSLRVNYESAGEVEENLELAYAISVHKSQGSEFNRVYFVLPKHKAALLSRELFYTGVTRARQHCTLLIQEDIAPLLTLRRREMSHLSRINSSLFAFRPMPPEYQIMFAQYEEGKIHRTLVDQMVRSKSEVIIANILADRDIPFEYEVPLYAPDGTFYLPDFTIHFRGETWYWEHLGMLHNEDYRNHWETKKAWYEKHNFANSLIVTQETTSFDSQQVLTALHDQLGL